MPVRWNRKSTRTGKTVNYAGLKRTFTARFGKLPGLLARAPGRVNLIGEHIDYSNCPVLPAAIDREIAAWAVPREDRTIRMLSDMPGFPAREFDIAPDIPPFETGDWGNYVKAGVQEMVRYAAGRPGRGRAFQGMDVIYTGSIPSAAGLSSSSALVVLSAMLFCEINDVKTDLLTFAGLMAEAERYVGTRGGGMDQAAILFGKEGHALKIDFAPLTFDPVPVPEGYRIIVADSLVKAPKTRDFLDQYNRRTIECRLAAAMLKKGLETAYNRDFPVAVLGDLKGEKLGLTDGELKDFYELFFHDNPYTSGEIAAYIGRTQREMEEKFYRRRDGTYFPEPEDGFRLKERFLHVMGEWERVLFSVEALTRGNMDRFGVYMNASHRSLKELYQVSCAELDELVDCLCNAGALGARLTGAGFGGCAVALVRAEDEDTVMNRVRELYYGGRDAPDVLFSCVVSRGAGFLQKRKD